MRYFIAVSVLFLCSLGLAERPRPKNSTILEGILVIRAISKDTDGEYLKVSQGAEEKAVEYFIDRQRLGEKYLDLLDSLSGGEKCAVRGIVNPTDKSILAEHIEVGNTGMEQKITSTGVVFVRDRTIKALGEAWRDPTGMIWGDLLKIEDLPETPGPIHHTTAYRHCKSIGAKLPSLADFVRLREYFGGEENAEPLKPSVGYQSQVLPNFDRGLDLQKVNTVNYQFWTDKVFDRDNKEVDVATLGKEEPSTNYSYLFEAVTGAIYPAATYSFKMARCVVQAKPQ